MLDRLWLIPVGFIIGTYGTLIGAGGGFRPCSHADIALSPRVP